MVRLIRVNTILGIGLLPDSTKPLPEQMLTGHLEFYDIHLRVMVLQGLKIPIELEKLHF